MRVIGFTFKKISIEKKKEIANNVNVNSDMKVINLYKGKTDLFGDKETLSIEYQFKIDYQPDFANLLFEGTLVLLMNDKNDDELMKSVLKKWKDKTLPEDFGVTILKLIFLRCNLKALMLEEYLGLPPHIPNPEFSKIDKNL